MKAGNLFAGALALLLFVVAYVAAFFAWAALMDTTGDFSIWDGGDEGAVWFALIAAALWASIGALIGRWWVMLVPLAPYLWLKLHDLVEFGSLELGMGVDSDEPWVVIGVCALGIGCGMRVWGASRGRRQAA